jgi:hypothetical protein
VARKSAETKRKGAGLRTLALGFVRRGIFGDRLRLRIGLVLLGLSVLRRWIERDEVIVYSERLDPGHTVTIRHLRETWG